MAGDVFQCVVVLLSMFHLGIYRALSKAMEGPRHFYFPWNVVETWVKDRGLDSVDDLNLCLPRYVLEAAMHNDPKQRQTITALKNHAVKKLTVDCPQYNWVQNSPP